MNFASDIFLEPLHGLSLPLPHMFFQKPHRRCCTTKSNVIGSVYVPVTFKEIIMYLLSVYFLVHRLKQMMLLIHWCNCQAILYTWRWLINNTLINRQGWVMLYMAVTLYYILLYYIVFYYIWINYIILYIVFFYLIILHCVV